MWPLFLLACSGEDPPADKASVGTEDTSGGVTIDTGTPPFQGTGDLDATCEADPLNVLRFHCSVRTDLPADATIRAWLPEAPERVRVIRSERSATEHDLLLWGLRASSTYAWRAEAGGLHRTGQLKTGALPADVSVGWELRADDPAAEVEGVLMAPSCTPGVLQLVDRDAQVVWYQDVGEVVSDRTVVLGPVQRTADDTILMSVGRTSIVEIDPGGNLLLDLVKDRDFDEYVHHDIYRHEGVTYALFVRTVRSGLDDYLIDGVYAFDASGLVDQLDIEGQWALTPHTSALPGYWTALFPGAVDFSHANALSIDADGDVVVSFRHLHAVVKFRGGPGTASFGDPVWTLVGSPASILWPGDFTLTSEPGVEAEFSGQHDAHFGDDGQLLLFDNRFAAGGSARAMRLDLDTAASTVRAMADWSTDETCTVQGSVRELGENLLTTCAAGGHVFEFAPGVPEPIWHLTGTCSGGVLNVNRGVPWDLWE